MAAEGKRMVKVIPDAICASFPPFCCYESMLMARRYNSRWEIARNAMLCVGCLLRDR